jgi:hypothetical protein
LLAGTDLDPRYLPAQQSVILVSERPQPRFLGELDASGNLEATLPALPPGQDALATFVQVMSLDFPRQGAGNGTGKLRHQQVRRLLGSGAVLHSFAQGF